MPCFTSDVDLINNSVVAVMDDAVEIDRDSGAGTITASFNRILIAHVRETPPPPSDLAEEPIPPKLGGNRITPTCSPNAVVAIVSAHAERRCFAVGPDADHFGAPRRLAR